MRARIRLHHDLDLPPQPRFAGFEAYAAREIFPWLAGKEVERRLTVKRFRYVIGGTAAAIVLLQILAFTVFDTHPAVAIVAFGAVPAVLGGAGAYWLLHLFRSGLKDFLLPKVCDRVKLRYLGTSADIPFAAFVASGMLPRHDRHVLEDGVESEESGIAFDAAEARLVKRTRTSKGGTSDTTVWRGLLMAARAPRPFDGLTLLMPERGFIARVFESRPAERIELGFPQYESGLEIRTTLPEEARAVLNEQVMRRLSELARRLGPERPSLALMGEHVLLAIETKTDRFEGGSLFKPLDEPQRIQDLLWELAHVCDLAEALGAALKLERARTKAPNAATPQSAEGA